MTPQPATVAWWEGDEHDRISSWLAVGAGSPPLQHEAWVAQLAAAPTEPGGWAAVSWTPLTGLGPGVAERLGNPLGASRPGLGSVAFAASGEPIEGDASADLHDECRAAAVVLVAERMRDEDVAERPRTSGILLLRLRSEGDGFVLDLAPAIDEPAWLGRPIDVDLGDAAAPTFGTETIVLAGIEATLPCAHLGVAGAGRIPVTLPKLWLPGAPEPVVHLPLS